MATLPPEPSVKPASPMSSWQTPQANSDNTGESVAAHRNRWLKKETVDLLRIRSDMDVSFQDAALKRPLWDEVSRKMGELGYKRSGTKCKDKFEKSRKEGPNSRVDHKNYCFFDQLEALHGGATAPASPAPALHPVSATAIAPPPGSIWSADTPVTSRPITEPGKVPQPTGLSFSSNNWSSSSSESDDKSKEVSEGEGRKRKREISRGAGGSRMMRAFLEGLMSQVVERQETMLQRIFEAIDKREAERLVREEAWRLQEAARLAHEHTLLSHERATAATRDAAILSFLQKLTGQSVELPPPPTAPEQPTPSAPHAPQSHPSPLQNCSTVVPQPLAPAALELVPVPVYDPKPVRMVAFSRWSKDEIETLIRIRSSLDHRYQEAGAKGPLWDEISVEMLRQGYNRSAKKCKEKWENINRYFKRMKENNRRRSPDAKTCPYYHQLDTLYRQKLLGNRMVSSQNPLEVAQGENKDNRPGWNAEGSGGAVTKVEDIVMELSMVKDAGNDYEKLKSLETDHMEKDNDDDAEGRKMQDKVPYQRQNKRRSVGGETCSFFAML